MGLVDVLSSLKDTKKTQDSSSMKISKEMLSLTKNTGKSFDKLLKYQEKSPIQKTQLGIQRDIRKKTIENTEKLNILLEYTKTQTRIMEQNQKIALLSNKYLLSLDQGLKIDRKERRISEDEEKRYRRRSVTQFKMNKSGDNKNTKDKKGILGMLAGLLGGLGLGGGTGLLEGALALIFGKKIIGAVKGTFGFVKNMFGVVGKGITSLRSFLFGNKILDEAGKVISKTDGLWTRLSKVGTKVFGVLKNSLSVISGFSSTAFDFLKKFPTVQKAIDISKMGLDVVRGSKLAQIGSSVLATGKNVAKPVIDVASKVGSKALSLGSKAFSGISNFLAPSMSAIALKTGTKLSGSVLGKMLPGVGALISATTAISDFNKGDYIGTALNGISAVTNLMGPFGMLASGMLTVVDMVRKGELTGIFNTVTEGIKGVTSWVVDVFSPTKFLDRVQNWLSGTTIGRLLGIGTKSTTKESSLGTKNIVDTVKDGIKNFFGIGTKSNTGIKAPVSNSTLAQKTFNALYSNEGSDAMKARISHAIAGNSNFTFGRSQFDIGQRPDAWKAMGYSDQEITKLKDIGNKARKLGSVSGLSQEEKSYLAQMQSKMYGKEDIINQLDMQQQVNLSNKAKSMVTYLGSLGFTFSSPSAIAQFADIYNQFGGMDKSKVPQLLQSFSGGKLITPEAILKYRLFRENNADQRRRFKNIESQFQGQSGQNITASSLVSQFNTPSATPSSPTGISTPSSPSSGMSVPKPKPFLSKTEGDKDLTKKGSEKIEIKKGAIGKLPTKGVITSEFGYRTPPTTGASSFHKGIDIASPSGTPIYTPFSGKVLNTYYHFGGGNTTEIDHGKGLITKYLHQSKFLVSRGQNVQAGQEIGKVGNTGKWTTGSHLHFVTQVNGNPVNPRGILSGNMSSDVGVGNVPQEMATTDSGKEQSFVGKAMDFVGKAMDFVGNALGLKDNTPTRSSNYNVQSYVSGLAKPKSLTPQSSPISSGSPKAIPAPKPPQDRLSETEGDKDIKDLKKDIQKNNKLKDQRAKDIRGLVKNVVQDVSSGKSPSVSLTDQISGMTQALDSNPLGYIANSLMKFVPNIFDIIGDIGGWVTNPNEQVKKHIEKYSINNLIKSFTRGGESSGTDTSKLGGQVTSAISQATGLDVSGALNKFGIDPSKALDNVIKGGSLETTLFNTKALDLQTTADQVMYDTQQQIKSTLGNIDKNAQGTNAGVSKLTPKSSSRERTNLLSTVDIGTSLIQSNLLG